MDDEAFLAMQARLTALLPRLNERDRRAAMAVEAVSWGRGGISAVHRAIGASRATIRRGVVELADDEPAQPGRRVRAPGAGRKKAEVADPRLLDALDSLVEPQTRGDQESPLRWTTKSTRNLARELTEMGHRASHAVVAKILGSLGYRLQGARKTPERQQPSDRDAQFRYINGLAEQFLADGDPVISVDTRKKELKASLYGPCGPCGDLADDSAWACASIDHDASVFAVATIEQWWHTMGKNKHPGTRRILVTADCGGSNGHRPWPWKLELARLAATTRLDIVACHYPSGTSKWNKIENRLFSRIIHNSRGQPLETYQTIVSLIANTTPASLAAHREPDSSPYPTTIKPTDQQRKSIPLARHQFHGDWNYTIRPANLNSREVG
ncbi:MAG: ISAzo13 family transposase [Pseudonocardiaceae bacterium]